MIETRIVVFASVAQMALVGCRAPQAGDATPPPDAFEITLELPGKPGAAPLQPPEAALAPFRVWINQETPRQKKTPEWRSFPARLAVVLELPPDGRWRCALGAVHVFGKFDEDATLSIWKTSRTLRCSSDGWSTYVEGLVKVTYAPDGKLLDADPRAALYLRDVVTGQPRTTVIVLEMPSSTHPG